MSENLSPERKRQISDFLFKVCKNYRWSYDHQCNVRPEQMLFILFLFKKNFITLYYHNLYHDYGGKIAISYNSQKLFHYNRKPNNIICMLISRLLFMICIFPFPVNLWFKWPPWNSVCIKYRWDCDCVLTLNKSTRRFAKLKCTIENSIVLNITPINAQWKWGTTQNSPTFTPVILISLFCHCNWNVNLIFWLLGELQVETYCCQNVSTAVRMSV